MANLSGKNDCMGPIWRPVLEDLGDPIPIPAISVFAAGKQILDPMV
jgi:hypothetical protein